MKGKNHNQSHALLLEVGIFSLLLTLFSASSALAVSFTAILNSAQEVAPAGMSNSPLTGSAQLELTETVGVFALSFNATFDSGFDFQNFGAANPGGGELVTNLHFHNNVRGMNGPVVFGIFAPSSDLDGDTMAMVNANGTTTVSGEWDQTEGNGGVTLSNFISALQNTPPGEDAPFYLNLHSENDPAGVIRGQLTAVPEPGTILLLGTGLLSLFGYNWKRRIQTNHSNR